MERQLRHQIDTVGNNIDSFTSTYIKHFLQKKDIFYLIRLSKCITYHKGIFQYEN